MLIYAQIYFIISECAECAPVPFAEFAQTIDDRIGFVKAFWTHGYVIYLIDIQDDMSEINIY